VRWTVSRPAPAGGQAAVLDQAGGIHGADRLAKVIADDPAASPPVSAEPLPLCPV